MPKIKQVARKIVIMEKFAPLDAETRYEEWYSERALQADLEFILTGEEPYPLPSATLAAIRRLNWESLCNQRIDPDPSVNTPQNMEDDGNDE